MAGGRTRLGVLGMTPAEIDAIEQTGEPKRLITVAAPRSGVVVNRGVTVGTSVWRTSLFPSSEQRAYVLPVKKPVRVAEALEEGEPFELSLECV